jgi:hypothetical protein
MVARLQQEEEEKRKCLQLTTRMHTAKMSLVISIFGTK